MVRIGDGKYKVGDKLIIFVRILRRHIMVRVGGGWQELSEFLRQKDPCRAKQHPHQQQITFNAGHQQPYSLTINNNNYNLNHQQATTTSNTPNRLTSATLTTSSIVSKSRLLGSSHHLNKGHHHYKHSGVPRLISGSASMSWLSHNTWARSGALVTTNLNLLLVFSFEAENGLWNWENQTSWMQCSPRPQPDMVCRTSSTGNRREPNKKQPNRRHIIKLTTKPRAPFLVRKNI